jgi:hypothetical protein
VSLAHRYARIIRWGGGKLGSKTYTEPESTKVATIRVKENICHYTHRGCRTTRLQLQDYRVLRESLSEDLRDTKEKGFVENLYISLATINGKYLVLYEALKYRKEFFQTQISTDFPVFSAAYATASGRDLWRRRMELFHGDNDADNMFEDDFFEALFSRQRKTTFCPTRQWRRKQAYDMAEQADLMDEVKSDADRQHRKIAYRGENRQSTFDEALSPRSPIPLDQKKPLAGVYQKIRLYI